MIISFKYKFIFIKTYKTAGSSIENYLLPFLNNKDILAPTEDYTGINSWGNFNKEEVEDYIPKKIIEKYHRLKIYFNAHMPIWLVKERLKPLSKKLNYDIFENFYKFSVIRNPFDTIVSHYYWKNSSKNINSKPTSFNKILEELENNVYPNYGLLNLNKLMDKNFEKIICNKIIKYESLNKDLSLVFNKLGIPFDGELKIYKKKTDNKKNYRDFFDNKSKKLIMEMFSKDIELFNYDF
jgi:hypothetical protein